MAKVVAFAIRCYDLLHVHCLDYSRLHFRSQMQPHYGYDSYVAALGVEVDESEFEVHWKDLQMHARLTLTSM